MKIGLVDVDGHRFPNLALMKISAFHKQNGDCPEFAVPMFGKYELVYMSKVFTNTPDYLYSFNCEIQKGGTGYKDYGVLPPAIEHITPDYSLYGIDYAMGFLTRGCPNSCSWCIVPKKEGSIRKNAEINEFIADKKKVVLLDNNILASDWGLCQIEECIKLGIKVDFNQGLDVRLIAGDKYIIKLLSHVKYINYLRVACDTKTQLPYIKQAVNELKNVGIKPYRIFVYTLIRDFYDSIYRIEELKRLGVKPFAQPYLDFDKPNIKQWQKDLANWTNKKSVFYSCEFKDFSPRKGFKCSEYYNMENK